MNSILHHKTVLPIDNFVRFCVVDTCNDIGQSSLACRCHHFDMDLVNKHLRDENNVVAEYQLDTHKYNQMNQKLNKFHHSSMGLVNNDLVLGLMQRIRMVRTHFHCIEVDKYMKPQMVFVNKLPVDDISQDCHIDSLY